ncbi:14 kDa phosphohistidine phosphatase, partial [Eschrichtius robustus]|nr:14 kDa phosphohistidine phosphatase [Eschrichtius robustus]
MAAAKLTQIPDVDIDCDSDFKYVLIRVHAGLPSGALARESKEIMSSYRWAEYHSDVYGQGIRRDAEGL